jgi:hypothetical protein
MTATKGVRGVVVTLDELARQDARAAIERAVLKSSQRRRARRAVKPQYGHVNRKAGA